MGSIIALGEDCRRFSLEDRVEYPGLEKHAATASIARMVKKTYATTLSSQVIKSMAALLNTVQQTSLIFHPIPQHYASSHAAPLLCAGLIGYRSFRFTANAKKIGFYGFGAAAHLMIQIARFQGKEVWAFTRPGDTAAQAFAISLGAVWAGDTREKILSSLDAAIIFAPSGNLIPLALQAVRKGGTVVCAGIHMSDIPSFSYDWLYGERVLRSVTNLTREDGKEFFKILEKIKVETTINLYPLEEANTALTALKEGKITGSAVLIP